eukprot:CAMPEP_0171089330 /NCGR_PEP_ID=MMETSP0766_2-20121228/24360_1 /TAXON_ID=439317 /ORGANISM="Gambierdiscus australes, Strain CAWD 149" /LENGTH=51 /DNA_ID=CAMNT_0011547185 /DNA_START=61 /DNA_END=212 /DNA_ORIENTATION=-
MARSLAFAVVAAMVVVALRLTGAFVSAPQPRASEAAVAGAAASLAGLPGVA